MTNATFFARSYADARAKLYQTARDTGGRVLHPRVMDGVRAADGDELATDAIWYGPPAARSLVVITSGTHGVEGFAGSGAQQALAHAAGSLLAGNDTAIVLVHAINPHGFSNLRRVNEHNVDLNRNFIDFDKPLPSSPSYEAWHRLLAPGDWRGAARAATESRLTELVAEQGALAVQAAAAGGQYAFPNGLFYGGTGPAWSNRTWRGILADLCRTASRIVHVDIHTGLGPYGYGELVYTGGFDHPAHARAIKGLSSVGLRTMGELGSNCHQVGGTMNQAVLDLEGRCEVVSVTLEYGTVTFDRLLHALGADNWLHAHDGPELAEAGAIAQTMLDAFYPDDLAWRDSVISRFAEVAGSLVAMPTSSMRD